MNTTKLLFASLLVMGVGLTACGGGGSGSGGPPPTITPQATACPSGYTGTAPNCAPPATTTTATGMLVDDPSGSPLAGIPVKLEPWTAGATPLPSPQATTAANGTFSIGPVANGHYLLVIGSDSPTDTTRPTIHDNVTLTGGTQPVYGPNLTVKPYGPIPTVTPPAVEINGDYRLDTLSATDEVPCLMAFNQQRAALNLPPVVADEWLTENAREANAFRVSGQFATLQPTLTWYGLLTTGNGVGGGQADCTTFVDSGFAAHGTNYSYITNANTQWYGGNYIPYVSGSSVSASGEEEFPLDPRFQADPNVPIWP